MRRALSHQERSAEGCAPRRIAFSLFPLRAASYSSGLGTTCRSPRGVLIMGSRSFRRVGLICLAVLLSSGLTLRAADAPQARRPKDDAELRYWLENMIWHHRF